MPFGAALSVHPVSSHATGEVIGQVIEDVGPHPDVAILLVTPGHAGALEDVARAVRRLLGPTVLIGATAPALVGQGADDRGGAGVALWAGVTGPVHPLRLRGVPVGAPLPPGFSPQGVVILGDQGSCDTASLLTHLGGQRVGAAVTGALTSGGPLVLDDRTLPGGAVGVAFGAGVFFEAVVAHGWRSIGPEVVVTESDPERALVQGLDGEPALERLRRLAADEVPGGEVPHMNRALGIGPEPSGAGTAATVRRIHGADRSNGAIAAGPVPVGSVVRFWVRGDPALDLRRLLAGRQADTALAFVAEARRRGYGDGDHDAEIIADALDITAVVGLVASTQIGPVGDRLEAVDGEASVALLTDR